MSRRKRDAVLDDAEALLCWAGLIGGFIGLLWWPPAFAATAAAIVVQAARGRIR
jgi:hypothetical protein